jgi:glycerol-3-phosphate acyltransferase PlsX
VRSVAVDLLGSVPPEAVIGGVASCLRDDPDLRISLVGPPEQAADLVAGTGLADEARLTVVAAPWAVADTPEAEREVRARRNASVRVAARLVRDGVADAFVSFGPVRAVVAAAGFAMGTLPGVTRSALAEVLRTPTGPVLVVDRGAALDARADQLAQFASLGTIMVRSRFGTAAPMVGLLSADDAREDTTRAGARAILAAAPDVRLRGLVSAAQAVDGDGLDVLVTDGLTGSVLFGALERADTGGGRAEEVAVVLGVDGIAVAGTAAPRPAGDDRTVATVTRALGVVTELRRGAWLAIQAAALTELVAGRRRKAGLPV